MKILIACETSGIVRDAFLDKGHDAWSCDVLPADTQTNRHIQDDVRDVLFYESWDMLMVAHPPCTRLCNSGVQHLKKKPRKMGAGMTQRQWMKKVLGELEEGASLFADLWNADVPRIAMENPIMHHFAKRRINRYSNNHFDWKATQIVEPYQYAEHIDSEDNTRKQTCLWLKNLPKLNSTGSLTKETARQDIHNASPSKDRWKVRSKFHHGLAKAMADQWGANL